MKYLKKVYKENNNIKIILNNKYVSIYIINFILNHRAIYQNYNITSYPWAFRVGFRVSTRSVEPWRP